MRKIKHFKLVIALLLISLFLYGCKNAEKNDKIEKSEISGKVLAVEQIKLEITPINTTLSENLVNEIKRKGQQGIMDVAKYFNFKNIDSYHIHVREGGVSFATGRIAVFAKWMLEANHAPIVHELTHLLCNSNPSASAGSAFFTEGIAVFTQEKYGDKAVYPFVDDTTQELPRVSVEQSMQFIRDKYLSLEYLIENDALFYRNSDKKQDAEETRKRKVAYIEAGSFFIFLDDVYGREAIKKLYYSSSKLDFKGAFGKDLDILEKEYIKYYKITQ
jgi:hypothetical protein